MNMKKAICLLLALMLLTALPATAEQTGGRADAGALAAAGGEMLEQIRALMGDETFVTASGANGEVAAQIAAWEEAMDGQPLYTRVYDYPQLDRTLAYMNDGAEAPELSDAARAYFQPLTVQILCSQASAQRGALYLAASNVLRAGGYYALPEGFEDCVVVYDFGDVAFAVSMRRETVVDQEIMIAQGCVCAPEVREMLEGIAALEESGERALDLPEYGNLYNAEPAAIGEDLLERMKSLERDETFIALAALPGEISGYIADWAETMEFQPLDTSVYAYPEFEDVFVCLNGGAQLPEVSDRTRAYFAPQTALLLGAHANAQFNGAAQAAASVLRVSGYYALPEGFRDCIVVYDFGAVAFIESMRRETVAGQEIVVAQGCVCAREVRETLEEIAGRA